MRRMFAACSVVLVFCALGARGAERGPAKITVDLREAPRRILHVHMAIPASAGPLTLYYPKWIPGEHGPNGPITDVAGLKFEAGGQTLRWQRDPADMFAFHCQVPDAADGVNVALDFLEPPASTSGFTSGSSVSDKLAVLNWNQVVLYPSTANIHEYQYQASVILPAHWKSGTALPPDRQEGNTVHFKPVGLATLIDSPVLAGRYFKEVAIGPSDGPPHFLELACDSAKGLEMPDHVKKHFDNLVAQTGALFGARHYRSYRFLISLSDHVAHFGEEHHECTDIRVPERSFIDDDLRKLHMEVMAHEFVHSWNGKYRRPAGLVTKNFQDPERTQLLWVYEGLTQYLGTILTARAGFWTPEVAREYLATVVQGQENQRGRAWRPLEDTATAAQLLYAARPDWTAWRRAVDFYDEGTLLWLDVDTRIRQQTNGQKSLDDFCRLFHGGQTGSPTVVPYRFDDVVSALNIVAPYDWHTFLDHRVHDTAAEPPLDGLHRGGWKLGYSAQRTGYARARDAEGKMVDLSASLGLLLNEQGVVMDIIPRLPGDKSGIGPGMKVVSVRGRQWSTETVRAAVADSTKTKEPLQLVLDNDSYLHRHALDYHGGPRYPKLEHENGKPDLLGQILKARP